MTNSRQKGASGEREAAKWLTSQGFPAERGARNGVKSGTDIICDSLANLWIECKRNEAIDIGTEALAGAFAQACTDAPQGRTPIVLWRRNGSRAWRMTWHHDGVLVTAKADAWLLRKLNEAKGTT